MKDKKNRPAKKLLNGLCVYKRLRLHLRVAHRCVIWRAKFHNKVVDHYPPTIYQEAYHE